jgi:hypothetical protein
MCPYGGDGCARIVRRSKGRVAPVLGCVKRVQDSRRDRRQRCQGISGSVPLRPVPSHLLLDKQSSTSLLHHRPLKPPVSHSIYPLSNSFFLRKYCPTLRHFPPPQTGRQSAHSLPSTSAGQRHEGSPLASSIRIVQNPPQTSSSLASGRRGGVSWLFDPHMPPLLAPFVSGLS